MRSHYAIPIEMQIIRQVPKSHYVFRFFAGDRETRPTAQGVSDSLPCSSGTREGVFEENPLGCATGDRTPSEWLVNAIESFAQACVELLHVCPEMVDTGYHNPDNIELRFVFRDGSQRYVIARRFDFEFFQAEALLTFGQNQIAAEVNYQVDRWDLAGVQVWSIQRRSELHPEGVYRRWQYLAHLTAGERSVSFPVDNVYVGGHNLQHEPTEYQVEIWASFDRMQVSVANNRLIVHGILLNVSTFDYFLDGAITRVRFTPNSRALEMSSPGLDGEPDTLRFECVRGETPNRATHRENSFSGVFNSPLPVQPNRSFREDREARPTAQGCATGDRAASAAEAFNYPLPVQPSRSLSGHAPPIPDAEKFIKSRPEFDDCVYNAHSVYLRCTANPSAASCDGCVDYCKKD
jgi:Family of unknown function (DUF6464)